MKIKTSTLVLYGALLNIWITPAHAIGQIWDIEYNLLAKNNTDYYRATTKEFDLLDISYTRSNMPVQNIFRGSVLKFQITLPPGISYAAISGESNDWQGTSIGTYPVMNTFDGEPASPCFPRSSDTNPSCTDSETTTDDLGRVTAALSMTLYGNANPNFPVRTEESTVYFVLYNPLFAKQSFNFGSLRIVMLVFNRELYENWRVNGAQQVPATETTNIIPEEEVVLDATVQDTIATPTTNIETSVLSSKIINISTRSLIGVGDQSAFAGFIIDGEGTKQVVIKVLGESLQNQGVNTDLDPQLQLVQIKSTGNEVIAENKDWQDDERASEVPFVHQPSSKNDAVLFRTLPAGVYTAIATPEDGQMDIGLISVDILD